VALRSEKRSERSAQEKVKKTLPRREELEQEGLQEKNPNGEKGSNPLRPGLPGSTRRTAEGKKNGKTLYGDKTDKRYGEEGATAKRNPMCSKEILRMLSQIIREDRLRKGARESEVDRGIKKEKGAKRSLARRKRGLLKRLANPHTGQRYIAYVSWFGSRVAAITYLLRVSLRAVIHTQPRKAGRVQGERRVFRGREHFRLDMEEVH